MLRVDSDPHMAKGLVHARLGVSSTIKKMNGCMYFISKLSFYVLKQLGYPYQFFTNSCIKRTSRLKTCFVQDRPFSHRKKRSNWKLDIKFCFKMLNWIHFNIESYSNQWQIMGLDVENTIKCHSRLSGCRRPISACPSSDASTDPARPTSKKRCLRARAIIKEAARAVKELGHLTLFSQSPADRYRRKSVCMFVINSAF